MAETRTVHYERITGEDENGPNGEIWLDIQRAADVISNQSQQNQFQKTTRKLYWGGHDDFSHPTRVLREKRCERPRHYPTQFVPLNVIDELRTLKRKPEQRYQQSTKIYNNLQAENFIGALARVAVGRVCQIRRVYHWDATINADGTYTRIPGTEDPKQSIDVALFKSLVSRKGQGQQYQQRTLNLNWEPLTEYSELIEDDVTSIREGVVYLDPWQNVVNVQWFNEEDEPEDEEDEPEPEPFRSYRLLRLGPNGDVAEVVGGGAEDVSAAMAAYAAEPNPWFPPDFFHQTVHPNILYGVVNGPHTVVHEIAQWHARYWVDTIRPWPVYPPSETVVPATGYIVNVTGDGL